jgi:hypothetical protein
LQSNLSTTALPGGVNGVGPESLSFNFLGSILSLQTVFALFRDQPRFYNLLTYSICGAMLATWAVCTQKSEWSHERAWFALAAIAPVTMLITYHRPYDAKLLLLCVPACARLWSRGGWAKWAAAAICSTAMLLTADFPLTILMAWARNLHMPATGIANQAITLVRMRPAPLSLSLLGVFFLSVYVLHAALGRCDTRSISECPADAESRHQLSV